MYEAILIFFFRIERIIETGQIDFVERCGVMIKLAFRLIRPELFKAFISNDEWRQINVDDTKGVLVLLFVGYILSLIAFFAVLAEVFLRM